MIIKVASVILAACALLGCQASSTTTWNGKANNTYTTVMFPSLGGGAPAITILEVNGRTAQAWAGETLLSEVAGGVGAATAGLTIPQDVYVDRSSITTTSSTRPRRRPRLRHENR